MTNEGRRGGSGGGEKRGGQQSNKETKEDFDCAARMGRMLWQ